MKDSSIYSNKSFKYLIILCKKIKRNIVKKFISRLVFIKYNGFYFKILLYSL